MKKEELVARRKMAQAKYYQLRKFKVLHRKIEFLGALESKLFKTDDEHKRMFDLRCEVIKAKNNMDFHVAYMDWIDAKASMMRLIEKEQDVET